MCMTLTYVANHVQDSVGCQKSPFGNPWFYVCNLELSGDICGLAFIRFVQFTQLHPSSLYLPNLKLRSVADRINFFSLTQELVWH